MSRRPHDDDEERKGLLADQDHEAIQLDKKNQALPGITWKDHVIQWLPIFRWISKVSPSSTMNDVMSGLSVAVVSVPVGLSCALLAQRKPVFGLYAAVFPALLYTLFGSCGYARLSVRLPIPVILLHFSFLDTPHPPY